MADVETTPKEEEVTLTPIEEFEKKIKDMTTKYGVNASELVVNLAIEAFIDLRNYPDSWTEEKILADMEKNKAKIAMAAIELDAKDGVEGQTAHGESGYSRTYSKHIMAYKDVIGFANAF